MPQLLNTPELRFQVDEARKFAAMAEVGQRLAADSGGAQVDTTDGVRVTTADGWWLLRASNTQDVLVARAESAPEHGLATRKGPDDESLAVTGSGRGPTGGDRLGGQ